MWSQSGHTNQWETTYHFERGRKHVGLDQRYRWNVHANRWDKDRELEFDGNGNAQRWIVRPWVDQEKTYQGVTPCGTGTWRVFAGDRVVGAGAGFARAWTLPGGAMKTYRDGVLDGAFAPSGAIAVAWGDEDGEDGWGVAWGVGGGVLA